MTNKTNGSQHGGNGQEEDENVVSFPTLADRDRMRKEEEKKLRKEYRARRKAAHEPFFNAGQIPPLTKYLVAAFILIHLPLHLLVEPPDRFTLFQNLGFVPGVYTGALEWRLSALAGPLSHLFIHSGWMHLAFNTVMMLALGTFTEKTYGTKFAAAVFVACGLCGAALHFALNPFSEAPVIGASGGISGMFAVVLMSLYERNMLGVTGKYGIMPLIVFWVIFLIVVGMISGDNVAWKAHVGGFLGGVGFLIARKKFWLRI